MLGSSVEFGGDAVLTGSVALAVWQGVVGFGGFVVCSLGTGGSDCGVERGGFGGFVVGVELQFLSSVSETV